MWSEVLFVKWCGAQQLARTRVAFPKLRLLKRKEWFMESQIWEGYLKDKNKEISISYYIHISWHVRINVRYILDWPKKWIVLTYEQCKWAKCQSYASLDDDDVLGRLQNLDKICKEIDWKLYSTYQHIPLIVLENP